MELERLGDILPDIAGYLAPADALALGRTCRTLRSALSLTATPPICVLRGRVWRDRDDEFRYGLRIPVPRSSRVAIHSLRVSMTWRDQGWGNRKGSLCVAAEEQDGQLYRAGEKQEPGGGGRRIVYSSGIAPHGVEQLSFTFQPRPAEEYNLFYKVGAGGGHGLCLACVSVQALAFDGPSRCLGKALTFLERVHLLHPWDATPAAEPQYAAVHRDAVDTVLESTRHALARGRGVPPPAAAFFGRYGCSDADVTPQLMKAIAAARQDWERDLSAFKRSNSGGRSAARESAAEGGGAAPLGHLPRAIRPVAPPQRMESQGGRLPPPAPGQLRLRWFSMRRFPHPILR